MRRTALTVFVLAIAAYLAFAALPFLSRDRDFPATVPQPPPLTAEALDQLRRGDTLCAKDVAVEQHARQIRFATASYGRPGPRLDLRVSGPGYRVEKTIAAGYPDNHRHFVPIDAPLRPMLVTVCFASPDGRVALYGAADRSRSRVVVTRNGRPEQVAPQLAFYEDKPASIADRASSLADRVAAFHGFLGHAWLVWVLAVLVLVALPVGVGIGLWRALD